MSTFLNHVQHAPLLCDGAMGSLLFERTGRLSEQNHLYETFNADHPDLVRQVHLESTCKQAQPSSPPIPLQPTTPT